MMAMGVVVLITLDNEGEMGKGFEFFYVGFDSKERLIFFFCCGKGEAVVGVAIYGDKKELSVKAQLGVVVDVVRADGNYGFGTL
ncbi:hypothetical protein NC651_021296 [Populus alba x Populus x berolinensis]|nr:hypothetical protein NC651_021296 [Populus alba x Populus x berolinensis]